MRKYLLSLLMFFQAPVFAITLQTQAGGDGTFIWHVVNSCAVVQSSQCSAMVDCSNSLINTQAPAKDVCFATLLSTPNRFSTANALVVFEENCYDGGYQPTYYNEGGTLVVYLHHPQIQKDTAVQFLFSETGYGGQTQLTVSCKITQSP